MLISGSLHGKCPVVSSAYLPPPPPNPSNANKQRPVWWRIWNIVVPVVFDCHLSQIKNIDNYTNIEYNYILKSHFYIIWSIPVCTSSMNSVSLPTQPRNIIKDEYFLKCQIYIFPPVLQVAQWPCPCPVGWGIWNYNSSNLHFDKKRLFYCYLHPYIYNLRLKLTKPHFHKISCFCFCQFLGLKTT